MKVIFLDIDGVMNSHVFYENRHKKRWLKPRTYFLWIKSKLKWIFNGFKYKSESLKMNSNPKYKKFSYKYKILVDNTDIQKWKWLSEFCNKYNYKICISSVWKHHFDNNEDWNKALVNLGFNDNIFVGITGRRESLRGEEIKKWIDKHKNVTAYVILDDDSDMLAEQMKLFFLVDGYYGLTPNILYKINKYLK